MLASEGMKQAQGGSMQLWNPDTTPEPEHLGSLVPLVGPMSVHPGQHPCQIPRSFYRDLMALIP